MKKVRAFTIMELTVAMLISAIVISITYTAYLIVSKSYKSFSGKNEKMAAVLKLDELLKKDFLRSERVEKDTSGIDIYYPKRTVKYKFDSASVIRLAGRTDTFRVKTDSISTLFEGKEVQLLGDSAENNRIDELTLPVILQNQKLTYYYHKVYSSENLINRTSNALH